MAQRRIIKVCKNADETITNALRKLLFDVQSAAALQVDFLELAWEMVERVLELRWNCSS
jgi:hypothetical protein